MQPQALPSPAASAASKGPSKEEEAWKRSEEALKKKEQSVRNALKEKQRTLQQVRGGVHGQGV